MFPIRDHNPSGQSPVIVWTLIAVNLTVFLTYWVLITSESELNWFFYYWGLVPADLMAGQRSATLLTSMFLHGGWMHLAGNMWFLWIFGDNLEDELGHLRFLAFYLASGLMAAGLQIAIAPGSQIPMVGASGAIAGVMGGYLLLFPRARVDVLIVIVIFFRVISIPAWAVLGVWLGVQLFSGAATPTQSGGVAYWAHIGGFLGGGLLTLPALLRRGGSRFWQQTEGHPQHPVAEYRLRDTAIPRVPRR